MNRIVARDTPYTIPLAVTKRLVTKSTTPNASVTLDKPILNKGANIISSRNK